MTTNLYETVQAAVTSARRTLNQLYPILFADIASVGIEREEGQAKPNDFNLQYLPAELPLQ
jgi:hypothetical protein